MAKTLAKHRLRSRRKNRVRKKIVGTNERPRLAVFRSNSHISAQVIDDGTGRTLVSASTYEKSVKSSASATGNIEAAQIVGKLVAERATAEGVKTVVFDRGGSRYHGRVAALATAAREVGLEF